MCSGQKILIIEDDPDMIELLCLVLRRGGFEPISALGGREGLRKLQQMPVDLILLDLMMEDMSGWTVLDLIRKDKSIDSIPVLILSARHHAEDPEQTTAHASQFEGYLLKPFVVRDLLSQIEALLE